MGGFWLKTNGNHVYCTRRNVFKLGSDKTFQKKLNFYGDICLETCT
jgi:hypothetical protein